MAHDPTVLSHPQAVEPDNQDWQPGQPRLHILRIPRESSLQNPVESCFQAKRRDTLARVIPCY